jgi:Outer membrane lipoprotein-sorting protein
LRTATIFNLKNFPQSKSASARLIAAMILFFAVGASAQATNDLSDAEIQGRNLAKQLCEIKPAENSTNVGMMKVENSKSDSREISLQFIIKVRSTSWVGVFEAIDSKNNEQDKLGIIHWLSQTNSYAVAHWCQPGMTFAELDLVRLGSITDEESKIVPFCGSDFWAVDLGLEFFHWPDQRILPKTTNLKRGRDYTLLESTNPNPSANGYSRVLTWIDKETDGILAAEAYDSKNKLLKEFDPKSFKKVNGQWELQEMEIRNVQTGSRSRIEFDLNKQ